MGLARAADVGDQPEGSPHAGLFDLHLARWKRTDEHSLAHLASAYAAVRAMHSLLVTAAAEIDANPADLPAAQARARSIRHSIERLCTAAMDDLAVGAGPEPLAFDRQIAERTQQLQLYIRQCHANAISPRSAGTCSIP